jgi:hypothetical protein
LYMPSRSKIGGHIVFVLSAVILSSTRNLNLGFNFWMLSSRALIFHRSIPCDKTLPWVKKSFWPCDLDLGYIFWIVCTRAFIFLMIILYDKIFSWVLKKNWPCVLDLGVWPTYWKHWPWLDLLLVGTIALTFHRSASCDKTLPCLPRNLSDLNWPWCLT